MNEEAFNMSLRKFLKTVGVTSQREIEKAVNEAISSGSLQGSESLQAKAILEISSIGLSTTIEGDITLE
jgi:hypothetical protein